MPDGGQPQFQSSSILKSESDEYELAGNSKLYSSTASHFNGPGDDDDDDVEFMDVDAADEDEDGEEEDAGTSHKEELARLKSSDPSFYKSRKHHEA